jgi:hypothetical protein
MADLFIKIPKELGKSIEEFPEIKEDVQEFIRLRAFELELKRSKRLSLLLLKALTSKSALSGEEAEKVARDLGRRLKDGRAKKLKSMGLV